MSDKPTSKLFDMCVRGSDYREEYEIEMFGESVIAEMKPLVDLKFLPIAAFLQSHLGLDDKDEAVEEALERVEEAKDEAEAAGEDTIDISQMDEEFVAILQQAAKHGIAGSYDEDGNYVEHTPEMNEEMLSKTVGGYSVELGGKALEVSGDVRDATKFRGSRGGQRGFSSE